MNSKQENYLWFSLHPGQKSEFNPFRLVWTS